MGEVLPEIDGGQERFQVRNWKKVDAQDLKKMTSHQRSRYQAYEEPAKDVAEAQINCRKRLTDKSKRINRNEYLMSEEDRVERDKHAKLIGQLKAAEARNRLRIMRLRYQANKGQEISHLIACQPTALKAVRLQALVPASASRKGRGDSLDKLNRHRVEALLEDNMGLLTNRIS